MSLDRDDIFVEMELAHHLITDRESVGLLRYKGVRRLLFKIYKTDIEFDGYGVALIDKLTNIHPYREWSVDLLSSSQSCGEILETKFQIPPLPSGGYYIVAANNTHLNRASHIAYLYVPCNSILTVGRIYSGRGFACLVADATTGRLKSNYRYTLDRYDLSGVDVWSRRVRDGEATEEGGVMLQSGLLNGNYLLRIEDRDNSYCQHLVLPYYNDMAILHSALLITDRYLYMPRERILFSLFLYNGNGVNIAKISDHFPLKITLFDPSWHRIYHQLVETDGDGMVQGEITIPKNSISGRYTLEISDDNMLVMVKRAVYVSSSPYITNVKIDNALCYIDNSCSPISDEIVVTTPRRTYMVGERVEVSVEDTDSYEAPIYSLVESRYGAQSCCILSADGVISLPITPEMQGGINIVLYTLHQGSWRRGECSIEVPYSTMQLKLQVQTMRESSISNLYTIKVSDYQNQPVRAVMSIAIYDKSLSALQYSGWSFDPWRSCKVDGVTTIEENPILSSSIQIYGEGENCNTRLVDIPSFKLYDDTLYSVVDADGMQEADSPLVEEMKDTKPKLFIPKLSTNNSGIATFSLYRSVKLKKNDIMVIVAHTERVEYASIQIELGDIPISQ